MTERRITRWDPFADLDFFGSRGFPRFSRLVDDLWGEPSGSSSGMITPAVDLHEDDHEYVLTVELPGTRPEDVSVEVQDGVLSIRGEKTREKEHGKGKSRWVERSYGSFHRSFTLPANAATDPIEGSFKDGVLTVRIPKREEAKPRIVNISKR